MKKPTIIERKVADENHHVVTVSGGDFKYCTRPCAECPWRKDSPKGTFPAEAYRISARTAYDMGETTFACHMSGVGSPAVCAGFLLRGADHNMIIRIKYIKGDIKPGNVVDGGTKLYKSYRAMAEANGVSPSDPVLDKCR